MLNRPQTTDIALDRNVIRRVGEDHRGPLPLHQRGIGNLVKGTTAVNSMAAEYEEVSRPARWRTDRRLFDQVGGILLLVVLRSQVPNPQIDLSGIEADGLEI